MLYLSFSPPTTNNLSTLEKGLSDGHWTGPEGGGRTNKRHQP
jgi:hypothetical protein